MNHPDDKLLHLFSRGKLSPNLEADIERHLSVCPDCVKHLDQIERMDRGSFLKELKAASHFKTTIEIQSGHRIGGHYLLQEQLGQGGMGVIWKAYDEIAHRYVVLKFISHDVRHFKEVEKTFLTSFQKVHRLQHQHICPSYGMEQDRERGLFLVMKYIDGLPLNIYQRYRIEQDGFISFLELVCILRDAADALDYAHAQKIIHRDIKPQNIMIGRGVDGVQIIDFGIAGEIRTDLVTSESIISKKISGTRFYMAPEQWEGKKQDARTDQYSLAATAYELLSRNVPFSDRDIELLRYRVLHDRPRPLTNCPSGVNAALVKGLAKNRKDRFVNCRAFVDTLYREIKNFDGGNDLRVGRSSFLKNGNLQSTRQTGPLPGVLSGFKNISGLSSDWNDVQSRNSVDFFKKVKISFANHLYRNIVLSLLALFILTIFTGSLIYYKQLEISFSKSGLSFRVQDKSVRGKTGGTEKNQNPLRPTNDPQTKLPTAFNNRIPSPNGWAGSTPGPGMPWTQPPSGQSWTQTPLGQPWTNGLPGNVPNSSYLPGVHPVTSTAGQGQNNNGSSSANSSETSSSNSKFISNFRSKRNTLFNVARVTLRVEENALGEIEFERTYSIKPLAFLGDEFNSNLFENAKYYKNQKTGTILIAFPDGNIAPGPNSKVLSQDNTFYPKPKMNESLLSLGENWTYQCVGASFDYNSMATEFRHQMRDPYLMISRENIKLPFSVSYEIPEKNTAFPVLKLQLMNMKRVLYDITITIKKGENERLLISSTVTYGNLTIVKPGEVPDKGYIINNMEVENNSSMNKNFVLAKQDAYLVNSFKMELRGNSLSQSTHPDFLLSFMALVGQFL